MTNDPALAKLRKLGFLTMLHLYCDSIVICASIVDDASLPVCHHEATAPSISSATCQAASTCDLQISKLPRSNSAASYKPSLLYRWCIQGFDRHASTDSMG